MKINKFILIINKFLGCQIQHFWGPPLPLQIGDEDLDINRPFCPKTCHRYCSKEYTCNIGRQSVTNCDQLMWKHGVSPNSCTVFWHSNVKKLL